jgi:hypothetical protein
MVRQKRILANIHRTFLGSSNWITWRVGISTGVQLTFNGWYRQRFTAVSTARSNNPSGCESMTLTPLGSPSAFTTNSSVTYPETPVLIARAGYWGAT